MPSKTTYTLDAIDSQILDLLEYQGRLSIKQLATQIDMSAPSVTERLRRLESRKIITHFSVELDLTKLGYDLKAIVRIKPRAGKLKQVESMITNQRQFVSCDRVTGEDCYIATLMLRSIVELDSLLEPFHDAAETNTSIVKSSLFEKREPFQTSQAKNHT